MICVGELVQHLKEVRALENNMENVAEQPIFRIRTSDAERKEIYFDIRKRVIKLLYLIEDEMAGKGSIDSWFDTFMFELSSSNSLCDNKLTRVMVKIFGLYENGHYKTMTHAQIKRQCMECKGILDHLIEEVSEEPEEKK